MIKKHEIFLGSVLFVFLALSAFIYMQERIVWMGSEIILETRPVDPRDIFRGEYVILRYAIERDPVVQKAISSANYEDGDAVYVQLSAKEGQVATVLQLSATQPDFSDAVWMRGAIDGSIVRFTDLEQYFVPEGAGTPIENIEGDLHVKVKILNGEARVVGLLDGDLEPIDVYDYRE